MLGAQDHGEAELLGQADRLVGVPVVVRVLDLAERVAVPGPPLHVGQPGHGDAAGHR